MSRGRLTFVHVQNFLPICEPTSALMQQSLSAKVQTLQGVDIALVWEKVLFSARKTASIQPLF